jgi:hypothetical protein
VSLLLFLSSILQGYAGIKIQKEKYKPGKKERKIHQIEWADTRKKIH